MAKVLFSTWNEEMGIENAPVFPECPFAMEQDEYEKEVNDCICNMKGQGHLYCSTLNNSRARNRETTLRCRYSDVINPEVLTEE